MAHRFLATTGAFAKPRQVEVGVGEVGRQLDRPAVRADGLLLAPEVLQQHRQVELQRGVLGAALEQLKYSRDRYWKELRVALPPAVGLPRFDERADLTQIGVVTLTLILGRPLREGLARLARSQHFLDRGYGPMIAAARSERPAPRPMNSGSRPKYAISTTPSAPRASSKYPAGTPSVDTTQTSTPGVARCS